MRIVQLSDIHFGAVDRAALDAATAQVTADPPDLLMVTGDLTLNGLPQEFRAAERWLEALPNPLLVTPGNHDTPYWNLPLRALQPFARYRRYVGAPTASSHEGPGVRARMMNTARGFQPRLDWSKGAVNLGLARAAAGAMAGGARDDLRLVGCHHPLVEVEGSPVSGDVHRGQAAAEILCEGGVDVILTGHVHKPFAVALPFGDGRTYAVGASTLSLRTRGVPAGFNVLEAGPEAIIVTAQGWDGAAYTPWRTWTLPRRTAAGDAAPPAELSKAKVLLSQAPGD